MGEEAPDAPILIWSMMKRMKRTMVTTTEKCKCMMHDGEPSSFTMGWKGDAGVSTMMIMGIHIGTLGKDKVRYSTVGRVGKVVVCQIVSVLNDTTTSAAPRDRLRG